MVSKVWTWGPAAGRPNPCVIPILNSKWSTSSQSVSLTALLQRLHHCKPLQSVMRWRVACSARSLPLLLLLHSAVQASDEYGSGSVTFFPLPEFQGYAKRVFPTKANVCIAVKCLADAPRSIFWTNLDGDNTVKTDGGSIIFFSSADCTGPSVVFKTRALDSPATLAGTAVEKGIGSFAVRTDEAPIDSPTTAICVDANLTADAKRANAFPGTVTFHQIARFGGYSTTLQLSRSQQCYNLDIPDTFHFGSASWRGLSEWSTLNTKKQSQIFLYEGANCRGYQHRYPFKSQAWYLDWDRLTVVKSVMLEQYSPFAVTYENVSLTVNSLVRVPPFNGSVTFSDDKTGRRQEYSVNSVERCYNVACLDGRATNVIVSGIPTAGQVKNDRALLAVYKDIDCKHLIDSAEYPVNKPLDITDGVQSFMVWANYNYSNQTAVDDACTKRGGVAQTPISKSEASRQGTSKSSATDSDARKSGSSLWIAIVGGCVTLLIGVAISVWISRKRSQRTASHTRTNFSVPRTATSSMDTDASLRDIRIDAADVLIEAVVGEMDYAMVFRGTMLMRTVLVKKLLPELTQNESAREAFLYDAKLASELDHPKILKFIGLYWTLRYEVGSVYEYADVYDLTSFLRAHRHSLGWITTGDNVAARLPTKLSIAMDVAEALVLLHSFQPPYPHGSLSVKSVALTADGTAKLWNFRPIDVGSMLTQRTTFSTRGVEKIDIAAFGVFLLELDRCAPNEPVWSQFSAACPNAVTELARQCMSEYPRDRPTATEVFFNLTRVSTDLQRVRTETSTQSNQMGIW